MKHLAKRVIFLDNIDDEHKKMWYDFCDCFILISRAIKNDYEGFGIVCLEANLTGKPVMAGKSGGVADAVKDGLNELLVDPENIDEVGNAVIKLAQDENLSYKIGI